MLVCIDTLKKKFKEEETQGGAASRGILQGVLSRSRKHRLLHGSQQLPALSSAGKGWKEGSRHCIACAVAHASISKKDKPSPAAR